MAALNFPDSPNVNDVFTVGAREWIWDGSAWVSNSGREYTRIISETAPTNPIEGDEWYESNTGKLYIYFNDNWVQQLGFNPTKSIRSESANTSLVSGDANQVIRFTGTDTQVLTVDDVLSVGDRVEVIQDNSGQVEFSSGSGVNLLSTTGEFGSSGQNAKVEVMCVAAGEYRLFGDLGAVAVLEYLVIAGGGGGAAYGGGGAGGYRSSVSGESSGGGSSAETPITINLNTNYAVTVGAGGTGGVDQASSSPTQGANSLLATITSIGGGYGGGNEDGEAGGNGGSGGGDGTTSFANGGGGSGTANQGFAGGEVLVAGPPYTGAGGGGAGQAGDDGDGTLGGDGGDGVSSSITGTATFRAGGGGGGKFSGTSTGGGIGGQGGGGQGGETTGSGMTAGTVNTGGGGGGYGNSPESGANGGSGVVILRYPSDYSITIGAGLTGTENTDGSFKYTEITAGTGNVSFSEA